LTGDRPRDLRHLESVRQPVAEVVALMDDEHLRLVGEAPKRRRMDDAVPVALDSAAGRAIGLRKNAATPGTATGRIGRERPLTGTQLRPIGAVLVRRHGLCALAHGNRSALTSFTHPRVPEASALPKCCFKRQRLVTCYGALKAIIVPSAPDAGSANPCWLSDD